jgi:hypothetical protein
VLGYVAGMAREWGRVMGRALGRDAELGGERMRRSSDGESVDADREEEEVPRVKAYATPDGPIALWPMAPWPYGPLAHTVCAGGGRWGRWHMP